MGVRMPTRAALTLAFLAVTLAPAAARACPVCGGGATDSGGAYLFMSGVLSALPLLMMGGIAAWVITRARARDESEERGDRDERPGDAPSR